MPTLGLYADDLCAKLGIEYKKDPKKAEKEFDDLCFTYGLELDEVTSQREAMEKEKGEKYVKENLKTILAEKGANFERVQWKIDIPANRYDLLCLEGLSSALQVFRGKNVPKYNIVKPKNPLKLTIKKDVASVRPYCVMAVLRNIKFTKDSYDSFIELQDKLHQNIGRRRELVSMGTHDLDTLEGPFVYTGDKPEDINFIPLKDPTSKENDGKTSYNGKDLLTGYLNHPQLRAYVPLIYDKPVYPIIYDSKKRVCSLPPIINSWHSQIKLTTKNVLLDVTGLDYTKCNIVLDTLCAMFSQHCSPELTIEAMDVEIEKDFPKDVAYVKPGQCKTYPTMEVKKVGADAKRMKAMLNLEHLTTQTVCDKLERMMMPSTFEGDKITVNVPCTRSDIMHEVDLVEDLAISYGYDNLKAEEPKLATTIRAQPINKLTDLIRAECAGAGFNECLNFALCSKEDCFEWLKRDFDRKVLEADIDPESYTLALPPVLLSNPKAKEYNMVRTTLIQGLLKTLNHNKGNALPIRLFEVSDVCVQDRRLETGARNQRRVAALYTGHNSGFEYIHGMIDHLMYKLNLRSEVELAEDKLAKKVGAGDWKHATYKLVATEDPSFISGMVANLVVEGKVVGIAGVLRPDVLDPEPITVTNSEGEKIKIQAPWSIRTPCSVVEFNLELFLKTLEM